MNHSRRIRTAVVDDERPARQHVINLLAREPDVELVGEADGGEAAVALIHHTQPDLLFLDIQMPELNGFEVLRALPTETRPVTIFITAYDQHALAAFEAHAVDYLLKPYGDARFEVALERARRFLAAGPAGLFDRMQQMLDHLAAAETPDYLDHLVLKQHARVTLLPVEDIRWIEAAGGYVTLHTAETSFLYRALLGELERQLDPRHFIRIHRSAMVQVRAIASLVPDAHGEYAVLLHDGTRLKLSRTYRPVLEARLNQRL